MELVEARYVVREPAQLLRLKTHARREKKRWGGRGRDQGLQEEADGPALARVSA